MFSRLFCCSLATDVISSEIIPQHNSNTIRIFDIRPYISSDKLNLAESIPFVPPITSGLVIKVYDGDTFTLVSKLPYLDSPVYRFSVRLLGIDCAELKSKDETEKSCAIAARDELTRMVLNKYVTLHNVQTEKYGRILANVYVDDLNINKHMLEKRLAVEYDGKTKRNPEHWLQIVNGLKS